MGLLQYFTEADDARIAELAEAGYSARKIAEAMGRKSKNCIIGRAHRMGIPLQPGNGKRKLAWPRSPGLRRPYGPRKKAEAKPKAPPKPKTASRALTFNGLRGPKPVLKFAARPAVNGDIPMRLVTLAKLRHYDCRFPLGDPGHADFRYCGSPAEEGKSWCAGHMALVYQRRAA